MKVTTAASILAFLVMLTPTAGAASWVPVSCEDRSEELMALRKRAGLPGDYQAAWSRQEAAMRRAEAGDPRYVPHPYPKSHRQVVENFRHAFRSRLVAGRPDFAPRHRRTIDALDDDKTRYEVVRVENWEPGRCGPDRLVPFYHLVRVFDADGKEVSRTALHSNGLFAIFSPLDRDQKPLDDLDTLSQTVRGRFGVDLSPRRAQYVVLDGLPVPCSPIMPCIVFEADQKTFVVNHDFFLFSIQPTAPRLSVLELAQRPIDPRAVPLNAGRSATPWITVGFGFQQGRLVAIGPRGGPLE